MATDRTSGELAPHHDSSDASEHNQERDETAPFGREHNSKFDPNDVWDALSTERRRQTVRYLATHEDVEIGDVAEHIAAIENKCAPADLDADQRKRVYIGLHQTHLGNLDAAGVIDWNKARQTIERGEAFVRAHAAMEAFTDAAAGEEPDTNEADTGGLVGTIKSAIGVSA